MKRGRPLKGRERLEARLGFRVTKDFHERMLKVCDEQGISKTDLIKTSIDKSLYLHEMKTNPF